MRTNRLAEKFAEARTADARPAPTGDTLAALDARLEALRMQQAELSRDRSDATLAALDGNSVARQRAEALGVQLAAVESELAALTTARARAVERQADVEAAAAAQAEANHREEVRKATVALGLAADLVDGHLEQFRRALVELADRRDELRQLLAGKEAAWAVAQRFVSALPGAVRHTLAGARWGVVEYVFDDRTRTARVCDELPSPDAVLAGLERDKRKAAEAAEARRQRPQAAE